MAQEIKNEINSLQRELFVVSSMVSFFSLIKSIIKSKRVQVSIIEEIGQDEMSVEDAISNLKVYVARGILPRQKANAIISRLEDGEEEEEEGEEEREEDEEGGLDRMRMMCMLHHVAMQHDPDYALQIFERMKEIVKPNQSVIISDRITELGVREPENINELYEIGKRAKRKYIEAHGRAPPREERVINGRRKKVNRYTRDDLEFVDDAINEVLN
jgi:hypothetical protein